MSKKHTEESFWELVDKQGEDECWEWKGGKNDKGYGVRRFEGRRHKAHRLAYLFTKGPIPPKLEICHSCHNRACCNPAHLRAATHAENMQDMFKAKRQATGLANGKSKLNPDKVRKIRAVYANENMTMKEVGKLFGISDGHVWAIVNKELWAEVT